MAYGSWRVRHRTALARLAVQLHARAWIPADGTDAASKGRLTAGGAAAASEEYGGLLRAVVEGRATAEQEERLAAMEEEQWVAVAAGARGGVTDAVQPEQVARLLVAMAQVGWPGGVGWMWAQYLYRYAHSREVEKLIGRMN